MNAEPIWSELPLLPSCRDGDDELDEKFDWLDDEVSSDLRCSSSASSAICLPIFHKLTRDELSIFFTRDSLDDEFPFEELPFDE